MVVEEEKEALILATTLGHACMLLLRAHSGKRKIVVLLQARCCMHMSAILKWWLF